MPRGPICLMWSIVRPSEPELGHWIFAGLNGMQDCVRREMDDNSVKWVCPRDLPLEFAGSYDYGVHDCVWKHLYACRKLERRTFISLFSHKFCLLNMFTLQGLLLYGKRIFIFFCHGTCVLRNDTLPYIFRFISALSGCIAWQNTDRQWTIVNRGRLFHSEMRSSLFQFPPFFFSYLLLTKTEFTFNW